MDNRPKPSLDTKKALKLHGAIVIRATPSKWVGGEIEKNGIHEVTLNMVYKANIDWLRPKCEGHCEDL